MNRRIVGYEIVSDRSYSRLENAVNEKIAFGFEPLGSMTKGETHFFQPMVKYEDAGRQDITLKVFAPDGGE